MPVRAFHVAIYLASICQNANTASPIIKAFYSIKWIHDLLDLDTPTNSNLVKNVMEASKRKLAKPVNKKEPITVDMLEKVFDTLYSENNLKNQRIICTCLIAFAGFLRSEELLKLKCSDVIFENQYMSIFIESSKTV